MKRIKALAILTVVLMTAGIVSADEIILASSASKTDPSVLTLHYTATPPASRIKLNAAFAAKPISSPINTPISAPSSGVIPGGMSIMGRPRVGGKAFFEANLLVMVGLNIADYVSTKAALKYPGLEETNPLMKPFVKSPAAFAAIKFGTTALTYLSYKTIFKRNRTAAWILTTATNALLSYVVVNNVRLVQNARAAR